MSYTHINEVDCILNTVIKLPYIMIDLINHSKLIDLKISLVKGDKY